MRNNLTVNKSTAGMSLNQVAITLPFLIRHGLVRQSCMMRSPRMKCCVAELKPFKANSMRINIWQQRKCRLGRIALVIIIQDFRGKGYNGKYLPLYTVL